METYAQLRARQQERFSTLPMMFAFDEKQFMEGKRKLGVKDNSELLDIGYGGFIRKTDQKLLDDYSKESKTELKEALKSYVFCVSMFRYELGNHEYCYTYDDDEVFEACGLTREEVEASKMLLKAFAAAKKEYLSSTNP